jgi:hypothetical protein
MKKLVLFFVLLFVCAVLFAQDGTITAVFKEISGKVQIREVFGKWVTAEEEMEIPKGATISTGFGSFAVLELGSAELQVKQLTRMTIEDIVEKEGTVTTDLFLRVGKVRASVKTTEGLTNDFKVRSPVSTAAVRGTVFEFDGITLTVDEGAVTHTNNFKQVRIVITAEFSDPAMVAAIEKLNESSTTSTTTGTQSGGDDDDSFVGDNSGIEIPVSSSTGLLIIDFSNF